ncbi:MAG: hypothetical protein PHQ43_14125 [Dehalococcoidales bacterium]|nr:hypothetical protein [Dehalococcoidales bacterium]
MPQYKQQWVVPSESNPDRDYIVSLDLSGNYSCSCRGWTSHVPRRDCKHITYVRCGGATTKEEAVFNRLVGR